MNPAYVYRIFDDRDVLLYVGMSLTPFSRLSNHQRRDWWPEVTTITVQQVEDRATAFQIESVAIRSERPLYNVVGRDRRLPLADGMWWTGIENAVYRCPRCEKVVDGRIDVIAYRPDLEDDPILAEAVPGPAGWEHTGWAIWVSCLCHPYAISSVNTDDVLWLANATGGWREG